MTRNLRRIKATEADTLNAITDYLEILQAQGEILYLRHSPSNVILSWSLIKEILHALFNRHIGEIGAFNKIRSSCFRKLSESQLGAPDLIVFKLTKKETALLAFYSTDVLCIEVKSFRGKMTEHQIAWRHRAEKQGCRYLVARSLDEVMSEINALPYRHLGGVEGERN